MLRNIKDTGYPMRVEIWHLFTVKVWELAVADALMVATTSISLPLHRIFRSSIGGRLGLRWAGGGMAIQSIFQAVWLAFWVAYVLSNPKLRSVAKISSEFLFAAIGRGLLKSS